MRTMLHIGTEDAGARFDVFLAGKIGGVSRSQVQRWIRSGEALLNGKKAKAHAPLAAGDVVECPVAAEAGTAGLAPRPDIAIDAVHEDDDVIVVDKPAGMLVHPAVKDDEDTLANALVARHPAIAGVGDDPTRPGIVHRLDKDASGLLVVAKNAKAFASLKRQFQEHSIEKEYAVLVEDAPPQDAGTITLAIGRSASGGKMAARPLAGEDDREAITHYRVEERFPACTLLAVRTETGRTHQIRAHMHAIGCSVVGDQLYGAKRKRRTPSPRLFLHARRLAFTHPATGERMTFTSPLPTELADMLARLRRTGG